MNVSISLTPEWMSFIKAKVESGRYASTSEVAREALRMLERPDQREAEDLARLRQAWTDGVTSGDAGPLDMPALKAEARQRHAAKDRARA